MPKLLLGFLLVLVPLGCNRTPQVAEPTRETTPWLFPEAQLDQLTSSDYRARAVEARRLGRMGAKAAAAIPELEKLLEDEHPKVREMAQEALEKIRADLGE